MATIVRYVNTASSAGGDGTTNGTSGSTRAYASLSEAEAALRQTLTGVTNDLNDQDGNSTISLRINCTGTTADTVGKVDWSNASWVTDATHRIEVIGDGGTAQWDASKYRVVVDSGGYNAGVISIGKALHIDLVNLQVEDTRSQDGGPVALRVGNFAWDVRVYNGFYRITSATGTPDGSNAALFGESTGASSLKVRNAVFVTNNGVAVRANYTNAGTYLFYNATLVNRGGTNYQQFYGDNLDTGTTARFKNLLIQGATGGTNLYNSSSPDEEVTILTQDASAPGTGLDNKTVSFVDAANWDYHLASGDTSAKDAGTDLSGDANWAFSTDSDGQTRTGTWDIGADEVISGTTEQEGFRWGVDDGTESAHTWEAAQDTSITIVKNQARLLRVLVDGTGDPASTAYTLRYQKNGSGGYAVVPLAATTDTTPSPSASDATDSGNNTASASWALSVPNASTGDLLIFCLSWDDNTDCTDVTEPSGQNGETLSEVNATPSTDASTETRSKVWYCVCTGSWTAGTIAFTPAASEQWTGTCVRIPAGEFDATTPIGAHTTNAATGGAESNVTAGAFTAGASDGGGRLCVWTSADTDPQTVATGYTEISNVDRGAVSGGFFARDTVVSDSESISAATVSTIASDSWTTVSFVVRPSVTNNQTYITASANIAAGGEATTARLTAPSGKTTGDFVTGRRWDDENGSDSIDITADDYTEVEWSVALSNDPSTSDYFEYRVYAGASPLTTYTLTPRWTVGSATGNRRRRVLMGV